MLGVSLLWLLVQLTHRVRVADLRTKLLVK
jgi:hypothetical protein